MKRPRMDLYDSLPKEVREAVNSALCPISVEYLHGKMKSGSSIKELIAEIRKCDDDQHSGAAMMKVVPASHGGFRVEAIRRKKVRGEPRRRVY